MINEELQHDCVDFGGKLHQFTKAAGLIRLHMPGVKKSRV